MRRGFGKHCRVISEVNTDQLLKAMALHGDNADLRELLRDPQVDVALKRALGGVLQATSSIIGIEGHRNHPGSPHDRTFQLSELFEFTQMGIGKS